MMDKEPFFDSSPDSKEPNKYPPLATRPKAAFQWPPDWTWPFVEQKSENDT